MEYITQPWPWYVAGPMIAMIMFGLIYFGENFGVSSNLRTMCSIGGGGRFSDFFKINTKKEYWNLAFVIGSMIGGFLAYHALSSDQSSIALDPDTIATLKSIHFTNPGEQLLPTEIFGIDKMGSLPGLILLLGGGFLVGFGARYAGGCTSGHAISGISNLQLPSLIAVIGFFIGGLTMVHFIMPILFNAL